MGVVNIMIQYGRQDINQADIDAVVTVLRSDYLTQGATVPRFEINMASYCRVQHAVAVNSATSALHIACLALDLGPSDWLWTSPSTFVASSNCALFCGAKVDFVDIDPHTYNISIEHLSNKLARAEKDGTLPKIVVPVHLCGQSCDMAAIDLLSKQYGFKVIEDAAHAIGGKYKGELIGGCRYSDITIFSFHPVKIITTGEGGMALTNNQVLAERMQRYRSHGITSETSQMQARPLDEIWNYQQVSLGYNYRMTDIQAALGLSQMERLDEFVGKRHIIAQRYNEELASLPLKIPWQHPDTYSSYHLYPIRITLGEDKKTQRQVYDTLQFEGVNVNLHYIPVYRQPYYEMLGFKMGYCPAAEQYHKESLSIPIYPTLTDSEQRKVIHILHEALA
jgi:UDP-4-amino-4,6-dideoxy-N-acetyl-beta-L-altrosamine transaminase